MPVDLAVQFYERDRDSFASVLGAAIALRLFLFFVPACSHVRRGDADRGPRQGQGHRRQRRRHRRPRHPGRRGHADHPTTTYGLLVAGLWLTLWPGRSLTKVLAVVLGRRVAHGRSRGPGHAAHGGVGHHATFWPGVHRRRAEPGRDNQGIAVVTTSWLVAGVVYGVGWFLVCHAAPPDQRPGGAAAGGGRGGGARRPAVVRAVLPAGKLDDVTALAGGVGTAVVALGYMFLIGRVMATSLILDAVVFDRIGSVSELVFALPVLNRCLDDSPACARYFDLERDDPDDAAATEDDPTSGPVLG